VDRRGETAEADAALPEVFQEQHKLFQRPRQTVQLPNHKHVVLAHMVERLGEFRAVLFRAGRLLLIKALAAHGLESIELQGRVFSANGWATVDLVFSRQRWCACRSCFAVPHIYSAFTARGYGLLAVSYRGNGGSTGSPTEGGLM